MDNLIRIKYIKNLLPKTISHLSWKKYNTYSDYTTSDITLSEVINYECFFCNTKYKDAIAYTYNTLFNNIYRCLNCLHLSRPIIWTINEKEKYELSIINIVSEINKLFYGTFTFVNDNQYSNCSGDLCENKENKEIKGYKFKYNPHSNPDSNKFLCFMCYCNYKNKTGSMSMSRKPTNTRKRVNKKSKSTRKRVNKKSTNTRKRVNKKPKSTRKK